MFTVTVCVPVLIWNPTLVGVASPVGLFPAPVRVEPVLEWRAEAEASPRDLPLTVTHVDTALRAFLGHGEGLPLLVRNKPMNERRAQGSTYSIPGQGYDLVPTKSLIFTLLPWGWGVLG